jgi:hypothetical protein
MPVKPPLFIHEIGGIGHDDIGFALDPFSEGDPRKSPV